jgi:O-antigen/teichoic acid export membrane protein
LRLRSHKDEIGMNPVHRSILLSAIDRYGSLLFFLLSTAVLARLLTPDEFGVCAIVNALTLVLAAAFQEFGGANYLIQRQLLNLASVRTAFTVTFLLSIMVGAGLFFLRGAIAIIFGRDSLRLGIAVSVLNFLVWPFAGTMTALLRRDLQFGVLAACNLAGNLVTAALSMALAALNYSYMAPIWGALAGNVATTLFLFSSRRDVRFFQPSLAEHREVLRFGLYSGAVVIINVFYNFAPQFVLARVMDFAAVGLYSRAVTITQVFDKLVIQVLSPVIMPAVLAQTRAGEGLKHIYLDSIELLTAVHWPFLLVFAIMAEPIISLWLGPAWTDIIPLVRMLCIAYLALFAACLTYPVLVAAGRLRDTLISSLISLPPSLLIIFLAAFFGVKAVAAASLLCLPFQAAVAIYFVSRRLSFGLADLLSAFSKSGIVTALTVAGPIASVVLINRGVVGQVLGLCFGCLLAATGWLFGLAMTDHPLLKQVRLAARSLAFSGPKWFAGEESVAGPERKLPL